MVISRTPFRMSFFGGGTDFKDFYEKHGGSVISTTFDKYCYVSTRHLPAFFDYKYQVNYSRIERTLTVDEIEHPAVRNTLKYLDMREMYVGYDADLPARSGLGSSSSFVVGMLNAFYSVKGKFVDKKRIAEEAIHIERELCGETGGVQDQIAAAFGGFNRIDFKADGFYVRPLVMNGDRKRRLDDNLLLFFTGFTRFSSEIAKEQKNDIDKKKTDLIEMLSLVEEAEKVLVDKHMDLDEFGRLLDYTWSIKRGLTSKISTDAIDCIYEKAKKAGAVGGKLLGAGGGGFMVFYVPEGYHKSVRRALEDLLYVPFEFEDEGTRIMYYTSEEYEVDD